MYYTITFPGGHVRGYYSLTDAMISANIDIDHGADHVKIFNDEDELVCMTQQPH